jgi:hypothetical protein
MKDFNIRTFCIAAGRPISPASCMLCINGNSKKGMSRSSARCLAHLSKDVVFIFRQFWRCEISHVSITHTGTLMLLLEHRNTFTASASATI